MNLKNGNQIKTWAFLACFTCFGTAFSQQTSIEAAVYQGVIWRHTPKLTTQTGGGIGGQELGFRIQTQGRQAWQAWQRYPSLGVSGVHFYLGEGSHGRAFGVIPWLNVPIVRSGWFTANFRIATGLAWVAHPYNWWDNPDQNAIGSHWNDITQFRFGGEARLNGHTQLMLGGSFTHFSNGGSVLPNFGINILSGWVGATWSPVDLYKKGFQKANDSRKLTAHRWGGLLQGGYSAVQVGSLDGPRNPIWLGSGSLFFRFNKLHRASIGLDYELNKALYAWGLHSAVFPNERSARQGSTRLAVFVGEEFLFGDLGIQVESGLYIGKGINAYIPQRIYNKLSIRWYFPERISLIVRPFAGVTLKAHAFTAEYIAWNIGLAF